MGNINEYIYLYFLKDEEALCLLIEYYRPMVRGIISSRLQVYKVDSLVYCEYLSLADTLLVECLECYRYDLHKDFTGLYRCAFRNRSLDLKKND